MKAAPPSPDAPVDLDGLLAQTVAAHFPGAVRGAGASDHDIALGFGDLHLSCRVNEVRSWGETRTASLFFHLWGGAIGQAPVFLSMSGYGDTPESAVLTGACHWACAFGPVLRAGLAGEEAPDVDRFEVAHDGQRFRGVVDGIDRAVFFDGATGEPAERTSAARARLGGDPWLVGRVLEGGALPLLASDGPTVISVFVWDGPGDRVVEVKVDGRDWPPAGRAFAGAGREPAGAATLLRELAVLAPAGPAPPLSRSAVERTLQGLEVAGDEEPRAAVTFRGWRAHGGRLAAPLDEGALAQIEAELGAGALPEDYRGWLRGVARAGAGPGYGVLEPAGAAQRALARGTFTWRDGACPEGAPSGALALAHAGCGLMWLLVVRGAARGEVWLDARGSEGVVRRVAGSFSAWYRGWLRAAVRDASPWMHWDPGCCAPPAALSDLLTRLEGDGLTQDEAVARLPASLGPGRLRIESLGDAYFPPRATLDPCHGCVSMALRLGLSEDVFAPGVPPRQAAAEPR